MVASPRGVRRCWLSPALDSFELETSAALQRMIEPAGNADPTIALNWTKETPETIGAPVSGAPAQARSAAPSADASAHKQIARFIGVLRALLIGSASAAINEKCANFKINAAHWTTCAEFRHFQLRCGQVFVFRHASAIRRRSTGRPPMRCSLTISAASSGRTLPYHTASG